MKTQSVFFVAIIIALGGFLFGYDIAMMSGTTSQLEQVFNLNSFWLGFTVAIAILGTIVGTIIIGKPAEKFGRRRSLIILSVLFCSFLQSEAQMPEVGRSCYSLDLLPGCF